MAHFRLGDLEKANAALGRFCEAMKKTGVANGGEGLVFLREAELTKLDVAFPTNAFAP
jgi:hypothetical protein